MSIALPALLYAEFHGGSLSFPLTVELQLMQGQGTGTAWADSSGPFWIGKFAFPSWKVKHITFPMNMPGLFSFCNCHPYKFTTCHFIFTSKCEHITPKAFVASFTEDYCRPRCNAGDLQWEIWLSRGIPTLAWHSCPTCWMPVGSCPLLSQALDPTQSILNDRQELGVWAGLGNCKLFWERFSLSSKFIFVNIFWTAQTMIALEISVSIILYSNLWYSQIQVFLP